MIMFILLGYLTAFYQNQQQPQPRERDYFYVGGFFVFSIWIAIAIRSLIDIAYAKAKSDALKKGAVVGISCTWNSFSSVKNVCRPIIIHTIGLRIGFHGIIHIIFFKAVRLMGFFLLMVTTILSRCGIFRMLRALGEMLKLLTLVCLNTPWYIKQMKQNDPYNVGTLKIRYSDAQIQDIRPIAWEAQNVSIQIPQNFREGLPKDLFNTYNVSDSSVLKTRQYNFPDETNFKFWKCESNTCSRYNG